MIKCEIVEDLLPLYFDRTACEETKKLVEAHLQSCGACRRKLRSMQQEKSTVYSLSAGGGDYGDLTRRIRARRRRAAVGFGIVAIGAVYFGLRLLAVGEKKERE